MANTFLLEVATPERLLVNEQVSEAQIPAANGYLGILADHADRRRVAGDRRRSRARAGEHCGKLESETR